MKKFSFYEITTDAEGGYCSSINELILIKKYNLDNPDLINNGIINTDAEVAKSIGAIKLFNIATRETITFNKSEVSRFERRMFNSAGLALDLIGTYEFQKQLGIAYFENQIEELKDYMAKNLKNMEELVCKNNDNELELKISTDKLKSLKNPDHEM